MIGNVIPFLETLVLPVTWTLIHSIWQAALIGLLLALTISLLRLRSVRLRYTLSCVALLLVVGSTTVTAVYLSLQIEWNTLSPSSKQAIAVTSETNRDQAAAVTAEDNASTGTLFWHPGIMSKLSPVLPWVFRLWIAGMMLLSVYRLMGWHRLRQMTLVNTRPVDRHWQNTVSDLCCRLGISQHVELLKSAMVQVPCVVGWIKPVILVPVGFFTGLTPQQIELILAHEIAHIRRHDIMINYLQTMVETLLFFNPAVWLISRQIRIEREHCCDDIAVRHCGNPVHYARALVDLESRRKMPSYAAAATGGSLTRRIRRLLNPAAGQHRPGVQLASSFALVIAMVLTLGTVASLLPQPAVAATEILTAEDYEPSDDDLRGRWSLEQDDDRAWVQLRFKSRGSSSTMRMSLDDLQSILAGGQNGFVIKRDAGAFYCVGKLEQYRDEYEGSGRCYFRPDPAYIDQLGELGLRVRRDRQVFALALHDVSLEFIRELAEIGYDDLSVDRLIELAIHDVTPEYIRQLDSLGYHNLRAQKLVEMRIHDVDPEYIAELNEAGYTDLDPSRLVEMQIHDVDPEYLAALQELGYDRLSQSRLIEMRIHDVDPRFIREMHELGYGRLSARELIDMRIHNVDADDVREFADLGYKDIRPSRLIEFRIHNVTPRFVHDLAKLGFDDVNPDDLVAMRIHNVTPSYIRKLQDRGYKNLTPQRMIKHRIHGLD